MQKQTIDGHEFEFEIADETFKGGDAVPFYVKTLDGTEYDKYHVVIGKGEKNNPILPHIAAICLNKMDACMIAAAINIAKEVANAPKIPVSLKELAKQSRESAEKMGWDIAKAEAKMDELINEGKSKDEVLKYMQEHMMDFRKPDTPEVDAPKTAEEW